VLRTKSASIVNGFSCKNILVLYAIIVTFLLWDVLCSVVDQLFFSDPDPIFRRVLDPDPKK
jgi:hypothetical protein